MLIQYVLSFKVLVQKSSVTNQQIYAFKESKQTYWVKVDEKPIVSTARHVDDVWKEVFERAGWQFSGNTDNFIFKHHLLPGERQATKNFFAEMQPGQVISQIPSWIQFSKQNLVRHTRNFGNEYILPKSFLLPGESDELEAFMSQNPGIWMIAKAAAGSLGKGIHLTNNFSDIDLSKKQVVQEYLSDPVLIRGFKFDLRIYLLITSIDPLIAYVYDDGYAKLASKLYQLPTDENKDMLDMHLTNRGFNEKNWVRKPCWLLKDQLAFISYKEALNYLFTDQSQFSTDVQLHLKDYSKQQFVDYFHSKLKQTIKQLLLATYEGLVNEVTNRKFYARFGADVMLMRNGEFKIIEVNRRPYQARLCPIEFLTAPKLIMEELNIVGIPVLSKNPIYNSSTPLSTPKMSVDQMIEKANLQIADEKTRTEHFERIFPEKENQLKTVLNQFASNFVNRDKDEL
ncbi:Tubulin_tyrosine ligase [Hexamita inflata]|uniref:Tubulin--tyrosine ligase-like protein 5 n=1 Tax=Hexamita inflata TaxID=28002 RepID=A0ABP1GX20_9EUKA